MYTLQATVAALGVHVQVQHTLACLDPRSKKSSSATREEGVVTGGAPRECDSDSLRHFQTRLNVMSISSSV